MMQNSSPAEDGIFWNHNSPNHGLKLWFQQDGATCPTARATIDLLKDTFGDRLISCFGPVNWPPRSCDLTPLDYFLWVYVKSLVYADKPQTLDHFEDNIRRVITDIRPQMLKKVIENWTSRLDYIRASRGSPMPEIILKIRLHGGGLIARSPVRCVTLTPAHRRRRSLWCREHRNWRDNEWGQVLLTDESRFSLSSDSHRILIWRERGIHNHPSNINERDRYGGRGVLVWGGIMLGSRTDLNIFDAGSVNGTRYCNEILLPYVRLFEALWVCSSFSWTTMHHVIAPAEQLSLAARTLPPVMIRELRLALQDEWAAMPQQLIDTLILSMGRRCETCLAVRGDHIPY
ncbi:transposable element Tcb1 transposase [Trichonephila clavipes]|nr:transposable element Tcb1 transposase [Trichonephila clavipes]